MKRFNTILRNVALAFFVLLTNGLPAQNGGAAAVPDADSLEISLLTCGPRQKVYGLYGHTAIRLRDKAAGTDIIANYGVFSFDKPFFILRFVFGLTDYEIGIDDFQNFIRHYEAYGTNVRQQTLNLTRQEKESILRAIAKNYEPENRVYRYNYFYDNCTTRARDILIGNIDGAVRYMSREQEHITYRNAIHSYNEDSRWARFGNDLLLGVVADLPIDRARQQFLPDNVRRDFEDAVIVGKDGSKRPLVSETRWLLLDGEKEDMGGFPMSPATCGIVFAVVVIAISVYERVRNKTLWGVDAALMTAAGLCGLILFAMIFSQHPAVRVNFQILLLNPLALVFVYPSVKKMRSGKVHFWLPLWSAMIVIFFLCGLFQNYAEGMYYVALSLLTRYLLRIDQLARSRR